MSDSLFPQERQRMSDSNCSLPHQIWEGPRPDLHPRLFAVTPEDGLAQLHVSADEVRRWQDKGWISFDIETATQLEDPDCWEIEFVRDVARSGLTDAQIEELFKELPKPYRFDPKQVAYHFRFGWVRPYQPEPFEVGEDNISEWIETLDDEGDLECLNRITARIAERIQEIE